MIRSCGNGKLRFILSTMDRKSRQVDNIFRRHFSDTAKVEPRPVKFSETAAYGPRPERPYPTSKPLTFWEAMYSRQHDYKLFNRISFMVSLFVFMVYFLVFRDENDLDEELNKPLWQKLPSLEEQVLHERIILGKQKGEDVTKYEIRYAEILEKKKEEQQRMLRKR